MTSLPYRVNRVYPQIAKPSGLRFLLAYARAHRHSRWWIAPLTRLLAQEVR